MADEYRRFWIESSDALEREVLLASAFEAGAEGAEEREEGGRFRACIYAPSDRIDSIRGLLSASVEGETRIGPAEALPEVDWSEAWKEGLDALRISSRLVVRPPFVEFELEPRQREIVIDPGQAFGTGDHASTRLCLEWIDELCQGSECPARVLDVGTGSGVLALAAVALGAERAVGFDLDPVAIEAAHAAARSNGLEANVHFFTGGIDEIHDPGETFALVLANLLKREMLPIASEIAARVSPDGRLVLAGLLDEDVDEVAARFSREGLREVGRRALDDATGRWIGLCLARGA